MNLWNLPGRLQDILLVSAQEKGRKTSPELSSTRGAHLPCTQCCVLVRPSRDEPLKFILEVPGISQETLQAMHDPPRLQIL